MAYVEFEPVARVTSQTSNGSVLRRTSANMPRVRWCGTHSVLCLLVGICSFWIVSVGADCWYDATRHEEGAKVATAEPCLNCTCNRGALLCYKRVCPKLPIPPPTGCIHLHRYQKCCPELICSEFYTGGNGLESRSDPDGDLDIPYDKAILGNACFAKGSIYGPGSAMHSSSICEYCYCLKGKQTCIKPKCLLPIEGCTPMYDETSCCPAHYNCISLAMPTSSTTTVIPKETEIKGGCLVDGVYHPEGGKVLGVGHSVCDNCYCMKGLLRCEPLSCAPPLLGCTPVIRHGECCAASYNCSGTIQTQPEPYYGQFPIVSKEYAKLRKEVNRKRPQNADGVVTVAPLYVLADSVHSPTTNHRSSGTFGTTRHFAGASSDPSTTKPFYYNSMRQEGDSKHFTRNYVESKESFPSVYYATTNYEYQNTSYKRVSSTTTVPKPSIARSESTTFKTVNAITTTNYKEEKIKSPGYSFVIDDKFNKNELTDERLNRQIDNETNAAITDSLTVTEVTTIDDTSEIETATTEAISTIKSTADYITETEANSYDQTTDLEDSTTENGATATDSTSGEPYFVTLKTVLNSTDCINSKDNSLELLDSNNVDITTVLSVDANEINHLADLPQTTYDELFTTTDNVDESIATTAKEDVTEIDLLSKVKVTSATLRNIPSLPKIPSDIEAILNISKHKTEDYEYDYNEPSLPPSLPNLRIIPFVAADALDSKKEASKENVIYVPERVTDTSFGYTNLFSPPIETEGGFVPKDPPILDNFYDNAVSVPSITVAPKPNADCIDQEGTEVVHGQSVASDSPCVTCTCFYGNIVCQKPTCPIPRPGCRKSPVVQDLTLCCPHYICDDEEAPTVVLNRLEGSSNSQEVPTVAERIVTPDPFRDVIRTKPAPDLQSLIVDMMPFFTRKTTPLPQVVTDNPHQTGSVTIKNSDVNDSQTDEGFSIDKVLELLLSGTGEKLETSTGKIQTTTSDKTADRPSAVLIPSAPSRNEKLNVSESTGETVELRENANESTNSADSSGVGLLKLAGCNIYGRMYRVGRIISELSGPCLECKCTEIGVQCKALNC